MSAQGQIKPGSCPPVQNPGTLECPPTPSLNSECLLDKDCNGSKKCCFDGCVMKCQDPGVVLPTSTPNIDVKQGKCPVIKDLETKECPAPENLQTECLLDADCTGTKKCCTDGCSMKCQDAILPPTVPPIIIGPKGDPGDKGPPVSINHFFYQII